MTKVFAATFLALLVLAAGGPGRLMAAETAAEAAKGQSPALGQKVATFALDDYRGKTWSLDDFKDRRALVVAFLGTECPLVGHYAPRLRELATKYNASGVGFIGIASNQQDSLAELAAFARRHKIEFPLLKDGGNKVADAFHAQRTPEVFVLDADRRVVYHGRIDDQFTYGIQRPKVSETYLVTALDQLLAGKKIETPQADSVGCLIGRVLKPKANSDVTFSKHIASIFQTHCVSCHRPGEIGPFALTSYDEAVGWAAMIREVVAEQRMPPWHADSKHGEFINDTRLSDEEKDLIYRWVDAGAPQGDPKDLPAPREFTPGWQIGEPDAVVYMSEKPYNVPASGEVRYQYFITDPGFTEDKWIQAAECRPGNRAVVHHIIVGIVPEGAKRGQRTFGDLHSDWLTATAPGARPLILREGMAKLVPAGSKLVFQMHYTPNGTATQDRSCVGFKFADPKTVRRQVGTDKAANQGFRIPPGDGNHKVEASHTFGRDMLMLAMFPHMHLRGKAFRYTAIYPTGEREVLLNVPRYDFAWQNSYEFVEPKKMPKGTRLYCEAWFDNSEDNLANPDPTDTVRWGDQTWEEMMIGYFDATPDYDISPADAVGSRTKEFVSLAKAGKARLNDHLKELAAAALASEEGMKRFGPHLRHVAPQLDRVCWTTVEQDKLHVRRCIQEAEFESVVGGAGRKVDIRLAKLSAYAEKTEPIIHQQLAGVRGFDLQFMGKAYQSSLHVPVEIDGLKGTVNFWSAESDAFPPELVTLLTEVAKSMAKE